MLDTPKTQNEKSSDNNIVSDKVKEKKFQIQIDRVHYTVTQDRMTGAELRQVPNPPIAADRDLFEVVPGSSDKKIGDSDIVDLREGIRFFTAPATINPGFEICGGKPDDPSTH